MKKSKSKSIDPWWKRVFVNPTLRLQKRIKSFLKRRPHRSFRRTRRRDYVRSLKLPGYWSFTASVFRTIWRGRRQILVAALVYVIATIAVVGLASQELYDSMAEVIRDSNESILGGSLGAVGEAGALLVSAVTNNFSGATTTEAQVYAAILALLFWLTIVWLLRNQLAKRKVKFRDGLYNSGAPVASTMLVLFVLILQMVPIAIALIGFSAAAGVGALSGGVESMLIWLAIILLGALSLYWSISAIIALVVVTLPGMYPMEAIRTAGDLVVGRRVRIFLRFLWMVLVVVVLWAVIMIPIILLDGVARDAWPFIEWIPLVPISMLVMGSLTLTFVASYIYLFYRKIVEDDAEPA